MLSHISVRNYQSLGDISLDLKPFTVIVGPSSSGKSAFTRAMKTLTSNQRGDSFITHGESQCVIKATTDRGVVALLRGKKNEFVLIPEDGQQQSFTKLSGSVPEEVSAFIGIPAGDSLNYADQFDMPYMLKRSGGDVARELGALTNVSVIFEASREANRRRLAASGTLKTRASDYESLTVNLDRYRTLKDDQRAVADASEQYSQALIEQTRISALAGAIQKLETLPAIPEARIIPDISAVIDAQSKIARLGNLIDAVIRNRATADSTLDASAEAYTKAEAAQQEYEQALKDAGTCPTCGQETHDIHL
jgi:DNA repair ATPase RecN